MPYSPFLISDLKVGLMLNKEPWLLPQDAFATLEDGYLYQGVLTKRRGYTQFGRLSHSTDQNYTQYTEVDVGADRVSVAATTITVTDLDDDEDVYVYIDFGANYFDDTFDWEFEFDFVCTDGLSTCGLWSITQDIGSLYILMGTNKNYLALKWNDANKLLLMSNHNMTYHECLGEALTLGVDYYVTVKVKWSEGKVYAYIYTDSSRTVPIASSPMIVDFDSTDAYQYLYGMQGWNDAGAGGVTWDGEICNLQIRTYPDLPVVGIVNYYDSLGTSQLLAANTKRFHIYDTAARRFEDLSKADIWTGSNSDFIWDCIWQEVMYLTNGKDQIKKYDGAAISNFDIDIDGIGPANDVDTCRMIFSYKDRLVILSPTEGGFLCPQRARWCKVNQPADWTNDEYVDANTLEWIITAEFLGDDLIVFFERSIWRLKYTSDDDLPFIWEKIVDTEGAYAQFSVSAFTDELIALGPTGLLGTDGMNAYPIAEKLGEFTLMTAVDQLKYAYAADLDELKQNWLSFVSPGNILPDKILVQNYGEKSWSIYNLSCLCFGFYEEADDPTFDTWEPEDDTLDEVETRFDDKTTQAGYPITLAGDNEGYIWQLNKGTTDHGGTISFVAESGRWNPFGDKGFQTRLGWVDFLVDTDPSATITIEFYKNQLGTPYKTVSFTPTGEGNKTWVRITSGEIGAFHKIKILHTGNQEIRIHAILPWFKEAGRLV